MTNFGPKTTAKRKIVRMVGCFIDKSMSTGPSRLIKGTSKLFRPYHYLALGAPENELSDGLCFGILRKLHVDCCIAACDKRLDFQL